ncbi:MAG TPA: type I-E CRISPR-associated protein Cas5/CasD [Longimicrobiaceae bacterium]|nr:type I-E CRISPR-associated protein Cas5/CasD [Longimicrobiaceae bacterium]
MPTHLILRLEGPLQAWGDVAMDPRRPTRAFPSRSALAGLLANALGWTYRDAARTTALQDALRYAVREDRRPQVLRDYQTADLGAIGDTGWTRWGLERRGGGSKEGTQILEKFYLADGCFRVALSLGPDASVSMDDVAEALRRPARPLLLGRKGCPPATPLLEPLRVEAESPRDAIRQVPAPEHAAPDAVLRCWYDAGPDEAPGTVMEVWYRRDFGTNQFAGARRVAEGRIEVSSLPREAA